MTARPRHLSIAGRRPAGESFAVDTAIACIVRDATRRNAFLLLLDDVEHSHVDLDEPTYLAFEYVRWLGDLVDCLRPSGEPLDAVHLGGGAATLARYIGATRPAARQTVFELDAALVELIREKLPLPKMRGLKIKVCDARHGLCSLPASTADVVIRDAFRDGEVPSHLRTAEFSLLVSEILRPSGSYLLNVADEVPFRRLGRELAGLLEVFAHVVVVSEPAVFRGRRHGNLVVAASNEDLPIDAIARMVADGAVQGRVRVGGEVKAMARGHRPWRDADIS